MPPRLAGAGAPNTGGKASKKERIMQALSRMNDRDTQKAAAEDLCSILLNMDQEGLPIILSGLCTTGPDHKVYARKECARAIGIIASDACPLRDQALQQPHLGKMLGQLRRSLQDVDSSVREASSEALALVAQGLAQLALGAPQGTLANPVLKLLFECLVEQKKELNAGACMALGLAAPSLGTLDGALARDLVRKLNSTTFQTPAALLQALARLDPATGEPVGLIKSGPAAFVPLMSALVGQPAAGSVSTSGATGGSGVAGALARSDWPVRLAAADMLRATAMLLGPLMEQDGIWAAADAKCVTGRAIRALESSRFDKVREVRDVARAALAVLEELQSYGSAGGSAAGWPAHVALKLYGRDLPAPAVGLAPVAMATQAGIERMPSQVAQLGSRKSPVRRSATSPSRRRLAQPPQLPPPRTSQSPPGRRSPSPVFARTGSLSERFRAAHKDGDVSVLYPGGFSSELEATGAPSGELQAQAPGQETSAPRPPVKAWLQDDTAPDVAPSSRAVSRSLSKSAAEGVPPASSPLAVEPLFSVRSIPGPKQPPSGYSALAAADEAARMVGSLSFDNDTSSLIESAGPPTFSRFNSGTVAPAAPLQPAAGRTDPTVTVPTDVWMAAQERLRSLEAQHQQLLAAFDSLSKTSSQTITTLQARVASLEATLEVAQSQLTVASSQQQLQPSALSPVEDDLERSWLSRTIKPGSPLLPPARPNSSAPPQMARSTSQGLGNAEASSPQIRAAAAASAQTPQTTADTAVRTSFSADPSPGPLAGAAATRPAYREALSGGRVSDIHLLRLMQRTGVVWNELGHELASQLLASFIASLQQARADSPVISRMIPWLWRLADDQVNTFTAPIELRAPLLSALAAAQPSVTDSALYEKVGLLISTLRAHWSLPDTTGAAAQRTLASEPPSGLPPQASPLASVYGISPAAVSAVVPSLPPFTAPPTNPNLSAAPMPWNTPGADPAGGFAPVESQSPAQEAAGPVAATPRLGILRSSQAGRTPTISTLMGQWSDLQRDFAAMSSPAGKGPSRTAAQ